LLTVGVALVWPAVVAPIVWRSLRFERVARKAAGFRHRIVAEGVEVWSDGVPPKRIAWAELQSGRWLVHRTHTMASGFEESYALDLPRQRVALGGYAGELDLVVAALAARQLHPQPKDGGRTLGVVGWFVSVLWLGAALLTVALFSGLLHFR
jgi:hypothetical protein